MSRFIRCDLIRISREHNSQADALAKLASTSDMKLPRTITVFRLPSSNLLEDHQIGVLIPEPVGESWMTPIMNYLRDGTLPEDKGTAQRVRRQAPRKNFIHVSSIERLRKEHKSLHPHGSTERLRKEHKVSTPMGAPKDSERSTKVSTPTGVPKIPKGTQFSF
ncbi:hypothetical protein LWI29_028870 [Acer saccharum]|uniref:RNase H type-1 domain-containing protein n=1 Tax=Acer saccharum TaxID=4024 RepID=A0AA39SCV2_ACESA|nr:hypothetical protein LWI29_028870 [Acer saccharum]